MIRDYIYSGFVRYYGDYYLELYEICCKIEGALSIKQLMIKYSIIYSKRE